MVRNRKLLDGECRGEYWRRAYKYYLFTKGYKGATRIANEETERMFGKRKSIKRINL